MRDLARSLAGGGRALASNPGLLLALSLATLLAGLLPAWPLAMVLHEAPARTSATLEIPGLPELVHDGLAWWWAGHRSGGLAPRLAAAIAVFWLLEVFFTGGLLAVLRAPAGGWSLGACVRSGAFYFGRLLRVGLLALATAALVFGVLASLRFETDGLARQLAWLAGLLVVHLLWSHAEVLVVSEDRRSAALALVSAAGFCWRNPLPAVGQYLLLGAAGLALLPLFAGVERHLAATGIHGQFQALLGIESLVLARLALRTALQAGQLELQQARRGGAA